METQFELDDIVVDVVRKKIKHIYLRVYAPSGQVRVSVPLRMNMDAIQGFARSKLSWIREHQQRVRERVRTAPQDRFDGRSADVWGVRYPVQVVERQGTPRVELANGAVILCVRPGASYVARQAVLNQWYIRQLRHAILPLIAKWEPVMGVRVTHVSIRQMKTRWGSCSTRSGRIRLNLELAKKHPTCLEYVVVHEMVHLLEASHNHRFVALMDRFMKDWRAYKKELNREADVGGK